jgi:hypothetical protein
MKLTYHRGRSKQSAGKNLRAAGLTRLLVGRHMSKQLVDENAEQITLRGRAGFYSPVALYLLPAIININPKWSYRLMVSNYSLSRRPGHLGYDRGDHTPVALLSLWIKKFLSTWAFAYLDNLGFVNSIYNQNDLVRSLVHPCQSWEKNEEAVLIVLQFEGQPIAVNRCLEIHPNTSKSRMDIQITWVWVKPQCGDIMDAAIFYPCYRLTPGPHVSLHSCFYSNTEQLSCLTNDGFKVIVLLLSLVISVKTQGWRASIQLAVAAKWVRHSPVARTSGVQSQQQP